MMEHYAVKSRYFTWTLASLSTCYTSVFSDDGDIDVSQFQP